MHTELRTIGSSILYTEADHSSDRPILAAVMGEKILMIDAGASPDHARSFLSALRARTGRGPDFAVLTHWHWDHSFGLGEVRRAGAVVAAHRRCAAHLSRMREYGWSDEELDQRVRGGEEIAFCAEMIKIEYPGSGRRPEIVLPDLLFDSTLTFDLGGITAVARAVENDHSDDGVLVHVPEERCLFIGDMMAHDLYSRPPRYHARRVFNLFRELDSFQAEIFVESHGGPAGRAEFSAENSIILETARIAAEAPDADSAAAAAAQYGQEAEELLPLFLPSLLDGGK